MTLTVLVAEPHPSRRADLMALVRSLGHRALEVGPVWGREPETSGCEHAARPADVALVAAGASTALRRHAREAANRWLALVEPGDVQGAVRALREGALDAFAPPARASELRERLAAIPAPDPAATPLAAKAESGALEAMVGSSLAMRTLRDQVRRVAAAPRSTVLVIGESGTGKELVARAVHQSSDRASGPFVAVNCASLGSGLFESELFGYEPGAFTGARAEGHPGLLAAAEGGTLLLDEIGELELGVQARLLRLLEERSYRRVGGSTDRAADVRIVAATHRDLARMVEAGTFREDLYYRLNVLSLGVPPLRERPGDAGLLAEHFLTVVARELGRGPSGFTPEAVAGLESWPWPGNVRELRNCVERAAVHAGDRPIALEHLGLEGGPAGTGGTDPGAPLAPEELDLRRMEERLVRRALELTGGNKSASARLLGVNRATLYNKLRALELV